MALRRITGAIAALVGLALLTGLFSLFFAPGPNAHEQLIALGMPGVLLGGLVAILAVCLGAPFAAAPRFAARQVERLLDS